MFINWQALASNNGEMEQEEVNSMLAYSTPIYRIVYETSERTWDLARARQPRVNRNLALNLNPIGCFDFFKEGLPYSGQV